MTRPCVAVLGGYGVFGRRIAASLARHPELELIVAGRDAAAATKVAELWARARPFGMDATDPDDIARLFAERPSVVIDTIGPFQSRNLDLVRRCIEAGIHYVDIADSRAWVAAIGELDAQARAAGVLVIAGASTVPALSTAIVDELAPDPAAVLEIDAGITPGHRAPRGLATVRAILSYCGRPIPSMGGSKREFGWGGLERHDYPAPVGRRWLSNVDTPERALWPLRYPNLRRASVKAGLELGWMHLALSAWSRGVRAHLLPGPAACARQALRLADGFDRFGTEAGAMHVRVLVQDGAQATARLATIIAERADGPQIPSSPSAVVAKRLLGLPGYRPLPVTSGAMPCIGLLSLDEILGELEGFAIRYSAGGKQQVSRLPNHL